MRNKFITGVFALCLCLHAVSTAEAQTGIEFGLGLATPVSGRSIITEASNDSHGITRAEETLDTSPQLVLEFHKPYFVGDGGYAVGPAVLFTPSFSTTASSNVNKGQPIGGGFGVAVSAPTVAGRSFNLLVAWMIHPPQDFLGDDWRDGSQAPRDANDNPLAPEFPSRSASRAYVGFSVSGLF